MLDSEPKICFVIINYNSLEYTKECILSLYEQTYTNFQILLVDNNSCDNSAMELATIFPSIKIIKCQINLGFTGGCNLGIQYAIQRRFNYIFLINNDTTSHPRMLEELVNYIKLHPKTSLLTGKIYYKDTPNKIWYDGGTLNLITLEGVHKNLNKIELAKNKERAVVVGFASGCMMLVKREVFEEIGYFDDFFFAHYEDVDLCIRLSKHKKSIVYLPSSIIWHRVSATFLSSNKIIKYTKLTYYLKTRNKIYLVLKYKVKMQKLFTLILFVPKIIKYLIGFVIFLRMEYFRYVTYGIYDGLTSNDSRLKELTSNKSG